MMTVPMPAPVELETSRERGMRYYGRFLYGETMASMARSEGLSASRINQMIQTARRTLYPWGTRRSHLTRSEVCYLWELWSVATPGERHYWRALTGCLPLQPDDVAGELFP